MNPSLGSVIRSLEATMMGNGKTGVTRFKNRTRPRTWTITSPTISIKIISLQTNIMAFFFQYVRRNIDDISICPLVPHIGTPLMSYSTYHNAFHTFHYVVHHCIIFSTHVIPTQRMEYESNAYYYYLSHIIIVFLH